ncbi:hypothetical protein LVJ83_06575 [Uruburuella testudinis]|uniref:Uncharacterized protein n=1 Tax=Uruburuella testudinis TaxID=1282863 RepID=A0ABY4DVR2_9NEIS|nr:hypothetical protein [Uruburuella testudinis]UOO83119.1 hypothetical protein LVJ83_06575 [Uruburuella testudinis]
MEQKSEIRQVVDFVIIFTIILAMFYIILLLYLHVLNKILMDKLDVKTYQILLEYSGAISIVVAWVLFQGGGKFFIFLRKRSQEIRSKKD